MSKREEKALQEQKRERRRFFCFECGGGTLVCTCGCKRCHCRLTGVTAVVQIWVNSDGVLFIGVVRKEIGLYLPKVYSLLISKFFCFYRSPCFSVFTVCVIPSCVVCVLQPWNRDGW